MCGRFVIFDEGEDSAVKRIINAVNREYKERFPSFKTGEICPTDTVPVIARDRHNKTGVALLKWGFPSRHNPGRVIINARSETLDTKPIFKKILLTNRCLVPASGYYEWSKKGDRKDKYLIRPYGKDIIYMAGLYDTFTGKNGVKFTGFVIITTQASPQIAHIHHRMPVILAGERASRWLKSDVRDPSLIKEILVPYSDLLHITGQAD